MHYLGRMRSALAAIGCSLWLWLWLIVGTAAPAPAATLLQDVRVIDGRGGQPLEHADLLFADTHITAIGPHGSVAMPPDTNVVDAAGMSVLPGLISDHSHLGQVDGTTARSDT